MALTTKINYLEFLDGVKSLVLALVVYSLLSQKIKTMEEAGKPSYMSEDAWRILKKGNVIVKESVA